MEKRDRMIHRVRDGPGPKWDFSVGIAGGGRTRCRERACPRSHVRVVGGFLTCLCIDALRYNQSLANQEYAAMSELTFEQKQDHYHKIRRSNYLASLRL